MLLPRDDGDAHGTLEIALFEVSLPVVRLLQCFDNLNGLVPSKSDNCGDVKSGQ